MKLSLGRIVLAAVSVALVSSELRAASTANDNATNSVYSSGWSDGQPGGFGWDLWSLVPSAGATNTGFVIGLSTVNGPGGIDGNGAGGSPRSWGLFAGLGERADASRSCMNPPLFVGQILSIDMDNGVLAPGGTTGLSLLNANGNLRLTISLTAGATFYQFTDAAGVNATTFQSTTNGFRISFQLTNSTAYVLTLSNLVTNVKKVYHGTVASSDIEQVDLFAQGTGGATNFFNRMTVDCGSFPGNICAVIRSGGTSCGGQQSTYTGPAGMDTYNWALSANTSGASLASASDQPTVSVNNGASGAYTLGLTISSGGCGSSCSTNVVIPSSPDCTITGAGTICAGSPGQLCAPAGMAGYSWTEPNFLTANTQCILITTGGTYSVTVTDSNGCVNTCSKSVTVVTAPAIIGQPASQALCSGGNANFIVTATGALSYQWFENGNPLSDGGTISGATSSHLTLTGVTIADTAAQFYVAVNGAAGCGSVNSTIAALTVNPTPQVTPVATPNPVCLGDTLNLTATASPPADSYTWLSNGVVVATTQNFSIPNVKASAAGTYCVVASAGGCKSTTQCVTVAVAPSVSLTPDNNGPACVGASVNVTANGVPAGGQYYWTDPNNKFVTTNQSFTITNARTNNVGDYLCTYTSPGGCATQQTTTVVLLDIPTTQAFNNGPVCPNSTLQLTSLGASNDLYRWTGPDGFTANIQDPKITNAGTNAAGVYSVFRVSGNCTSAVAKTTVKVFNLPPCSIDGTNAFCAQSAVVFAGPADKGITLKWSVTDIDFANPSSAYIVSTSNNTVTVSTTGNVLAPSTFTLNLVVGIPGCTATNSCSMDVVVNPTPVITPTTLPPAILNTFYDQFFDAGLAVPPVTFFIFGLPDWLTATSDGEIFGTPPTEGNFCFDVFVMDANGCSAFETRCVGVSKCLAPTLQPVTFSSLPLNVPANLQVTMVNAAANQLFLTSGKLPTGLVLTSDGTIAGTPTVLGTYSFQILGVDANGCQAQRFYTINVVCPTIGISPTALPQAGFGVPYNQLLSSTGGTGPFTYSVIGGSLPAGMSLSSSGQLSGTPASGSTVFTVKSLDATGCSGTAGYLFIVDLQGATLALSPTTLPDGTAGAAYSQTVTATGGTAPIVFAVTSGSLPPGLTLSSGGNLTGTPTGSGAFSFVITATDANSHTGSKGYTVNIACTGITLSALAANSASVREPVSQPIGAQGGAAPFGFAVTSGALPPGLFLTVDGNIVTITGAPTTVGNFGFTLTATDSTGCSGSGVYSFSISDAAVNLGLTISGSSSSVVVGSNVTYTLVVTNAGVSTALGVSVADPLPAQLGFVGASAGCSLVGGTVVCNVGTLNAGASATLAVDVTTLADGLVTNVATVSGVDADQNSSDNSASTVTTVTLPPTLALSAATQTLSVEDGAAVLQVARTGNLNLPVTVNYTTVDGTAVAGVDYTATAGVLSFGVGVTKQTIVVPLLGDASAAGKSLQLHLSQPEGGIVATGGEAAVINLVASANARHFAFVDGDGDQVTVEIRGNGRMSMGLVSASHGPIDQVSVHGTDGRSQLVFKVRRAAGGDGRVTINSVVADGGLWLIDARSVDVVGTGVNVAGYLAGLTVHDLVNGAGVTALGNSGQATRIRAHVLDDGTTLQFGSGLKSIVGARYGTGEVIAPCLSKMTMKGDRALGIPAQSAAKLTIANGPCKP